MEKSVGENVTDQRGDDASRTHVAMVVSNDITNDARVKKEALTVARLGLRVTLLGMTTGTRRLVTRMGDVDVVRIPVRSSSKAAALERRARRRRLALVGWPSPDARAAAEARLRYAELDIKARSGEAAFRRAKDDDNGVRQLADLVGRRLALAGLRGRRHVLRGREWLDGQHRVVWQRWDRRWGEHTVGARWQRILPEQVDRELSFGPVLDRLAPDVIHAHDADMTGVAALAVGRARLRGRDARWIYDAHEFVVGLSPSLARSRRVIAAWADYESQHIRSADQVVTVSPQMAAALEQRYGLPATPAVVLNTPVTDPPDPTRPTVREVIGLRPRIPLLVYSGIMTPARGVETAIAAVRELSDVHLALVCVPHARTYYVRQLRASVTSQGLDDRVHFLDPVPPGQVVEFLSSADVGIFSGLRYPSHDVTLANKLFEYLYAGLPLVVSDLRAQADLVNEHRIGRVFPVGDEHGMARAVREVVDDIDAYMRAVADPQLLATYSWTEQEETIRSVYEALLGRPLPWADGGAVDPLVRSLEESTVSP